MTRERRREGNASEHKRQSTYRKDLRDDPVNDNVAVNDKCGPAGPNGGTEEAGSDLHGDDTERGYHRRRIEVW